MSITRTLGANLTEHGQCEFCVWAPYAKTVYIEITPRTGEPVYSIPMRASEHGYHYADVSTIQAGDRYFYCLPDGKYPDPASDYQPEGIFGPSEIVARQKASSWNPQLYKNYVIYELHVGAYTESGTFLAIEPYLAYLKQLGITAIELMPIGQFPGVRNWGYDGVFPFAVQNSYGGPAGLKAFINACHQHDLSVIVDVVYNHLGPEGNVLSKFGPYFTTKYTTPWGAAINVDDTDSPEVRRYFIENALHWFSEYGVDALRLDAVHAITDMSPYPFLEELTDKVRQFSEQQQRPYYLIVENDMHDIRQLRSKEHYGFGINAMWNNDFHYAIQALLTHDHHDSYHDYGALTDVALAYEQGFSYLNRYSTAYKKMLGPICNDISPEHLIIFLQNHDQIGNRTWGDRLTTRLSIAQIKLAASLLFCSPYTPMLFMGEEYGETAPFQYFIDHHDNALIDAVRAGRRQQLDTVEMPDPYAQATYVASKLNHEQKQHALGQTYYTFYQQLIALHREYFVPDAAGLWVITTKIISQNVLQLYVSHSSSTSEMLLFANFDPQIFEYGDYIEHDWQLRFNTECESARQLAGYGFMLFTRSKHHGT